MKKLLIFLIWIGLLPIVPVAWAQTNSNQLMGFYFKSHRTNKINHKFKLYNNLIVLPIKVEGIADTLNFILDTGVSNTLIVCPQTAALLQLPRHRKMQVFGADRTKPIPAYASTLPPISFKGIEARNLGAIVVEEEITHLSEYAGLKIHGLIGYDFFNSFVITIDYAKEVLVIQNPAHFKMPKKTTTVGFEMKQMKPYIKKLITCDVNTPAIELELLVDIGAGHSLLLELGSHPNIQLPANAQQAQLGTAIGGSLNGHLGKVAQVNLSGFSFEQVPTSFPDTTDLYDKAHFLQTNGSIGYGLLKRFWLTFNYPKKEIYLKPNSHYDDPFLTNTSGIHLAAVAPEYKTFKIAHINYNSPAQLAGLQIGDIICAIDNQAIQSYSLGQLYKMLDKDAGKKVSILVQRGKKFLFTEFRTQNLINPPTTLLNEKR